MFANIYDNFGKIIKSGILEGLKNLIVKKSEEQKGRWKIQPFFLFMLWTSNWLNKNFKLTFKM